jgi:transglutaminase-like putative cysteine protease
MELVAERVAYRPGMTNVATTAAEAIAGGSGVCQDQAHVFIAAARLLGIPARYVGGYLCMEDNSHISAIAAAGREAGHAWAEGYDPERGWVGFDPTNQVIPSLFHVRTSIGLDYESAAPVRGIRRGLGSELLQVDVKVSRVGEQ